MRTPIPSARPSGPWAALHRVVWAAALPLALAACGGERADHLVALDRALAFGRVPVGQEVERVLRLRNDGARGVVLTAVTPSCPCLHPDGSFRRSLGPHEEVEIRVRLVTRDLRGGRLEHKYVDVLSDDPKAPRLRVPVEGEIEERLTLAPTSIRVGPEDADGRGEPRRLKVRAKAGYALRVERVELTNPTWFAAEVVPVAEGLDVLVRVLPDPRRRGAVNEHLRLWVLSSSPGQPELRHDLIAVIQGAW